MVTVAVADFVGSACEIAVTETDAGLGTADGARYSPSLFVPNTVVETSPFVELPPLTPLTCQVTAVFVDPETVAVNGCVASVAIVIAPGEIATLTCAAIAVESSVTPRTSRTVRSTRGRVEFRAGGTGFMENLLY